MSSNRPFIIAEMSANHLGSLQRAKAIVIEAARAGADAVKLQTFTPEQMVGPADYVLPDGPWKGRNLLELYREAHTPREWHAELFELIRSLDMVPLSTPFHTDDVDFLETMNCPIYKIASFELNDHELIEKVATTGKRIIISTGMATREEIVSAMNVAYLAGAREVKLLRCVSSYPANPADANLETILHGLLHGLSDHTKGIGVAIAAVALGAEIIEKHLCLSRLCGGPDAEFSLEPAEFAQMVTECRRAAEARGQPYHYGPGENEASSLRRSLWYAEDIKAGTVLERHHIKVARPAGLRPASDLREVIGTTLAEDVKAGDPVK